MAAITDDFGRSNNTNLPDSNSGQGWDWVNVGGAFSPVSGLGINTNKCYPSNVAENLCYSNYSFSGADYYVQAALSNATGSYIGVHARANNTNTTRYEFRHDIDGTINLLRLVSGVGESNLASASQGYPSGDVYRIEVSGTGATVTITCKINGTEVFGGPIADSNANRITSQGFAAIRIYGATDQNGRIDDFEADVLAGGGGAKPAYYYNRLIGHHNV